MTCFRKSRRCGIRQHRKTMQCCGYLPMWRCAQNQPRMAQNLITRSQSFHDPSPRENHQSHYYISLKDSHFLINCGRELFFLSFFFASTQLHLLSLLLHEITLMIFRSIDVVLWYRLPPISHAKCGGKLSLSSKKETRKEFIMCTLLSGFEFTHPHIKTQITIFTYYWPPAIRCGIDTNNDKCL